MGQEFGVVVVDVVVELAELVVVVPQHQHS